MAKKDYTIGILGGMGTYATIHAFKQYAEVFPAVKEWDRPRLIIDNRCTMPSRVRAFFYKENVNELINKMAESLDNLLAAGCDKILLACNTSHIFLPYVFEKVPKAKEKVINIIDTCVEKIKEDGVKTVYLLATEGTIESNIYQNALEKKGVKVITPCAQEYHLLRECIECVKQNKYTNKNKKIFLDLMNRSDTYLLGCTELPVLYEKYKFNVNRLSSSKRIYDPVYLSLQKIKEEFDCD